jgi:hypothetical protein
MNTTTTTTTKPPELSKEDAVAVTTAVECEIRDFVRRDVVAMRRSSSRPDAAEVNADHFNALIELTNYAQATQAALASVKIITDSMAQWKNSAGASPRSAHG